MRFGKYNIDLTQPQVMGILNITPDSFSDGGQLFRSNKVDIDSVLRKAEGMCNAGAAILDVGGESTRPGATPVSTQEEMDRVMPVVRALVANLDVVVSVDTSTPSVITESAQSGAGLINDVRALERDGALQAAAATGLPVCLMHIQGLPESMQDSPSYSDVVVEVNGYLESRVELCISGGIDRTKILLDPGFGFGKNDEHNLALLKGLREIGGNAFPLLVGMSRKSMIGRLLGRELDARLPASLALAMVAMENGATILRVHDVAETIDAVKIFQLTR